MKNSAMSFIKGMGAGMIAGATVTIIGKSVIGNSHNISKGSTKVVRAASDFIDGVQTMFK